jgi:hypothetical protein
LYIKTIILPRQAWDKHRESTQKNDRFLAGVLTIRQPAPLPNSTLLRLRGVKFLGATLDITANLSDWTVELREGGAAAALEVVDAASGRVTELTVGVAVSFPKGSTAHVARAENRATTQFEYQTARPVARLKADDDDGVPAPAATPPHLILTVIDDLGKGKQPLITL